MSTTLHLSPSDCHYRLRDAIKPALAYDGGDMQAWQRRLRPKVKAKLGDWSTERVPLNERSLWRREIRLGTIDKVAFTSEPGADIVAYLCLPKKAAPPYALMICVQGHTTGMHHSVHSATPSWPSSTARREKDPVITSSRIDRSLFPPRSRMTPKEESYDVDMVSDLAEEIIRPDFHCTVIPQEPLHFRAGLGNIKLVCRIAKPAYKGFATQRRGIAVVA